MPVAYLPSPARGLWYIGPLAIHGYAVCVVLGIVTVLWVAERRYRAIGGRPWLILDLSTLAIPAGLLGARCYRLVTDYRRYFGPGRDWVNILRIWDGGLGLPGAAAVGLVAAWLWCRRNDVGFGPVLAAAVPGLVLGEAIGVWGAWFSQSMYGAPSTVPWAVEISPLHRLPGYQGFRTFAPQFLYESIWDLLIGLLLIYAIRRLSLTGDRALALSAALYAAGWLGTQSLRVGAVPQIAGIRIDQLAMIAVAAGAGAYLYATRARHGPEALMAAVPGHLRRAQTVATALADDMQPSPNASRMAGDVPPESRPA